MSKVLQEARWNLKFEIKTNIMGRSICLTMAISNYLVTAIDMLRFWISLKLYRKALLLSVKKKTFSMVKINIWQIFNLITFCLVARTDLLESKNSPMLRKAQVVLEFWIMFWVFFLFFSDFWYNFWCDVWVDYWFNVWCNFWGRCLGRFLVAMFWGNFLKKNSKFL